MYLPSRPIKYSHLRGFTLIELLVVIVIISISISLIVVNFSAGGEKELVEKEILRMQQLLRFAHQQSVIRAEEYGIRFYKTGYRFLQYNELEKNWSSINNDKLLRSRTFPEELELDLYIDQLSVDILDSPKDEVDRELALDSKDKNDNNAANTSLVEEKQIKPQIFLLSSSELVPPFNVRLRIPGSDIEEHLYGLPQGEFSRTLENE